MGAQQMQLKGYPISKADENLLLLKVIKTLQESLQANNRHPIAMLELPVERKVIVIEAADLSLPAQEQPYGLWFVGQRIKSEYVKPLADEWFDYDAVLARLKYVPSSK